MNKMIVCCAALCALALAALAGPAQAQSNRTWVSGSGRDTGNCAQTAPCASFTYALSQTNAGGEIDCLGSGDYGAVTITGSITIDCGDGEVGRVDASGGAAINIVTSSTATIVLRHLNINGFGASQTNGIAALSQNFSGGTLIIEHCLIQGFTYAGISFGMNRAGRGSLEVSDTVVANNGDGINVFPNESSAILSLVLDGVKINSNSQDGLYVVAGSPGVVAGTLRHSVVAENGSNGIEVDTTAYFTVEESSVIDNLGNGVTTDASGADVEVGASTIGGNGKGVYAQSGKIYSFGNNQMSANGSNGTFTSGGPGLQ